MGRRNLRLRWELANLVALCPAHHTFSTESAHQDPVWFMAWLEENREDDLMFIENHRNEIVKRSVEDMQELFEKLRSKPE